MHPRRITLSPALNRAVLACLLALPLAPSVISAEEAATAVPHRLSPFGIGSSGTSDRTMDRWLPMMAEIGVLDLRSVGGSWGVRPGPDRWSWKWYEQRLDLAESLGVTSAALLNGVAAWNTKDKKHALPLNSLPEWKDMTAGMVEHLRRRVNRFEVWNEPPNGTMNAPASDYAKVVIATHEAAKAVDPHVQIGIAAKSAHISYLDQALRAGARGHFDYVTLHPYEILGNLIARPGTEAIYMGIAPTVRKMLAAQDPQRRDCDIIFTELGYDSSHARHGHTGVELQWHAVIKAYTLGIAQGIACINWYEAMDGDAGPLGLMTRKGDKRPAFHALARLIEHLGRHPTYVGWVLFNERHYGFVFEGATGPVLVTWAARWTPETISFGAPVRIIDPATGMSTEAERHELSVAPVIVPQPPASLIAEATANRAKPFPWGGDFSTAKSVSVTFGATNIEEGLHTMSAESIAQDVLAYGGNARAGSVPGGNVFMVDPNFLSYDTVPIEITAVVRRNEQNEGDTLVLEYESTTGNGYKKAPAFAIPDNKQWHTATWRVDDSQFVGTWAFNFRLNKGPYAIQSVTVTRLDR